MRITKTGIAPLVWFFVLAFVIAWSLMGIVIAANYGWIDTALPFEPLLILGSWIPNIAAIIVLGLIIKRKGAIRELFKGWLKFRVNPLWYLAAISPVILGFLTIEVFKALYGYTPSLNIFSDPLEFIVLLVLITITGAMGEELGWRGFALPWLQTRMSALGSSVLLGSLWSIWHLPLWFAGAGFENNPFWAYFITGVAFSIMLTWACNNSKGSLVIASLGHLALNVSVNMFDGVALPVYGIMFILFAAMIVLVYGQKTLSKGKKLPINPLTKAWTLQ